MTVKCKNCNKELRYIKIDEFDHEGADTFNIRYFDEEDEDAIVIETTQAWTGYELDEEEQSDTIRCPFCEKFPFYKNEVQVYNVVRLVCFDNDAETEDTPKGDTPLG